MSDLALPVARPLILCRDVVLDPDTGNVHVIGVFDAIRPAPPLLLPHRLEEWCVFVQLADAQGEVNAVIRIVEADTQDLVFETRPHRVRFPNRRMVVRANFRLSDCALPRPGVYWVELHVNGWWLTDQTLRLLGPGD